MIFPLALPRLPGDNRQKFKLISLQLLIQLKQHLVTCDEQMNQAIKTNFLIV